MVNQLTRNVLTVFIASPGDLPEERRVTREVADKVNRIIGSTLCWQIDVLGSEETLPGTGRPQEKINKDVANTCDLFIGLLWKRWGSSTGKYSSGFEEEFECARKRHTEIGSPEIWLCFKKVERDQIEDAGPQLQRVLAFRETQINSKEVLFKEFLNTEEWKEKLEEWLLVYILRLNEELRKNSQIAPEEGKSLPQETQSLSLPSVEQTEENENSGSTQLTELINFVNQSINNNELGVNPRGVETLDRFYIARLALLAKTWMSLRYSKELLSAHEINLLYQYKENLETTAQERILLLRTLIHDPYDVTAGWYWFQDIELADLLLALGMGDKDAEIQKRALQLLELARICLTTDPSKRRNIRKIILMDESATVRKAGLAYLGTTGTIEDIPITDSALGDDDSSVRSEAVLARQSIIVRNDPNRALSEILDTQKTTFPAIISQLEKQSNALDEQLLSRILQHQDSEFRAFAIRQLAQGDRISKEQLFDLLKDESTQVKKACYQTLVQQGTEIDLQQAKKDLKGILNFSAIKHITLSVYKWFAPERLLEEIDWFSFDSSVAYQVLAVDHFSIFAEQIRSDLNDSFKNLRQKSIEKLYAKYEKDYAEGWIDGFQEHDDFTRNRFIAAALAGLALHGESQDIHWGRLYLRKPDSDLQLEAVRIIERFGNDSDVAALIDIAKKSYGELETLAANAALKLAPGISGAAKELLQTDDSELVGLVIKSFCHEEKAEVFSVLEPLLGSKNTGIRSKVLVYFIKMCSKEELEQLLLRYLQRSSYFYDVVCWLDRILYAPPLLKDAFVHQMEGEIV